MRTKAIVGLTAGAGALLAFGVWLGAQRPTPAAASPAPHAVRIVDSPRPAHAVQARPALAAKKPAPGLAVDLRDPDPRVRRNAIAELAASSTPDVELLRTAARDANLDVALAATEGLGTLYRDGAISANDLVARIADTSTPEKVRVVAINGLGVVASPDGARVLVDLLARGDLNARRSAAIVLVHQDATIAVPALIAALRDADDNVRANARESLRVFARGRDLGDDASAWQRWWQTRAN